MSDSEMRKTVIEMRHCSNSNQALRSDCAALAGESIMDLSNRRLTEAITSLTFTDAARRAMSAA